MISLRLSVSVAGAAALLFGFFACGRSEVPPTPSSESVSGTLLRDGLPLPGVRMTRTSPPLADGGEGGTRSVTSYQGRFAFTGFSLPFSLSAFDSVTAAPPRTIFRVVDLGKPEDHQDAGGNLDVLLRFGLAEPPTGVWRTRARLWLDADPSVPTDPAARTIFVAGRAQYQSAIGTPNPDGSFDVALEWKGPYSAALYMHALRIVDGNPIRYLGHAEVALGDVHPDQVLEGHMEMHPVRSQSVALAVEAPNGATPKITVGLDFGEDNSVATIATNVTSGPIEMPIVAAARMHLRGSVEHDGDTSFVAVPPFFVPGAGDPPLAPTVIKLVAPPSVSAPAEGASVASDARFALSLPATDPGNPSAGSKLSWVHEIAFTPVGDPPSRLGYLVVTHAAEATLPSGADLATPSILDAGEEDASALPGPSGLYEWTAVSYPDLAHVDAWSAKERDRKFERMTRTRPRRVTFAP